MGMPIVVIYVYLEIVVKGEFEFVGLWIAMSLSCIHT